MIPINSLYLHFPYCRHLCNYCDFYKTQVPGTANFSDFHRWLEEAWEGHSDFLREHDFTLAPLRSLYFGGGTPSLWGLEGAKFFACFLRDRGIELDSDGEWTMELNPGGWDSRAIGRWMELGVNRFSVGVQALEDRMLALLDRMHRGLDVHQSLGFLQGLGVNYSVDMMIGLPHSEQYRRDIIGELQQVLSYGPSHISLYILTVPKHYLHFAQLPSEEWIAEEYLRASEYLEKQGMVHYEVSNFAFPGKESWHNLQYWTMQSVAAIGPSATGLLVKNNQDALRYKWQTTRADWVCEPLGPEEIKLERLYMLMRTNRAIEPGDFFVGEDLRCFRQLVDRWHRRHYLLSTAPLRMAPRGYLVLDGLLDDVFREVGGSWEQGTPPVERSLRNS